MKEMKNINKNSINAIIADLPYGVTKNNWDTPLDLDEMWGLFKNILCKENDKDDIYCVPIPRTGSILI